MFFNVTSACGEPCHCSPEDRDCIITRCTNNCLDDFKGLHPVNTVWEWLREILLPTLIYIWICVTISFLITLWFYLVYKHKWDEHPWKNAIKRTWPWWIVVLLLLPFVLVLISLLLS